MTARSILWAALAAVGVPLLIEGTGGCSFDSPRASSEFIDDNAYTCGCTCQTGPRNPTFAVSRGSDDAEQIGEVMNLADADLDLGAARVGLRFTGVALPPGVIIDSAVVQFTARESASIDTMVSIDGLVGADVSTFTDAPNDISLRPGTDQSVPWSPGAWTAGEAGPNQQTPDLAKIIQELVNNPFWTSDSSIALRFSGPGQRSAFSHNASRAQAAKLLIAYRPGFSTDIPVCATPEIVALNVNGKIPQAEAAADCQGRVADTLESLTGACGYAETCTCDLVIPEKGDASFDRTSCEGDCVPNEVDGTCGDFHPMAFAKCVANGASVNQCAAFVSATHAGDAEPVCVASNGAPAMSARLMGRLSTCEVEGTSHIEVGDREPTHDPDTVGTIDILGEPCPGGGCNVAASFGLAMDPITFSVRFHSDPTFSDLSASAESVGPTMLSGVDAVFAADGVEGTGNGRRGSKGLAVDASNAAPLVLGVDWTTRNCDLTGNVASTVDNETPDGHCEGDGTTECTADSPDCDDVGGPCVFEEPEEDMAVDVAVAGTLVNQPPSASAGPDQTVECTSPAGASFVLDGTASDPDGNISIVSWREGRVGLEVGQSLVAGHSLGVGESQIFGLRVTDTFAQTAEDEIEVEVVDTTAPQLSLTVSPSRLSPPNHKLVVITATIVATDTCDANPVVALVSITSNEPDNGLGDGDQPNDIQGAAFGTDDRQFLLRNERAGTGSGRVYTVTYAATDASGNTTTQQATVKVPFP